MLVSSEHGLDCYPLILLTHTSENAVEDTPPTRKPSLLKRFSNFSITCLRDLFVLLAFTVLLFCDFRPIDAFGQMFTVIETSFGALLLALLVFVLGRRAAR